MFGYVVPDKPNLLIKDFALYRAHYCGLCKELGKYAGQLYRFATNYDSTFLSLLLHNLRLSEPKIEPKGCILNEFKKKPIVVEDEILQEVSKITLLLFFYKVADDVTDEGKNKAVKIALSRHRKRIKKEYPTIDKLLGENYKRLVELEKNKCAQIDALADCFAKILEGIIWELSQNADAGKLGYFLGRWIYLMDAIDDCEKDFKRHNFNPLLVNASNFVSREEYLNANKEDLKYLLYSTYSMIVEYYDKLEVTVGEGALSNIIYQGLPSQMERILKGDTKCQKIRI